jgi:transposase
VLGVQPTRTEGAADGSVEFPSRVATGGLRAQKKRPRASEVDRPDVAEKRAAFLKWVRRIDPDRLVFLDEAGANIAMGRSHAWVQRGEEYVEARPMNWGDNLTLVGAVRRRGWVTLSTKWRAMTKERFVEWVRRRLAPRLQRRDVVLLDNLAAHKALEVRLFIEQRGATVRYLPPYSHDFNPIEPAWALVKKRIRTCAPRSARALRRVARAARYAVTPYHCRQYFAHAGYGNSSGNRD